MWVIRLLLPTLLLVLIIGFAFLNPGQKVEVDLFFAQYLEVQLAIVVLFSILTGMLLMFFTFRFSRTSRSGLAHAGFEMRTFDCQKN